MNTHKFFPQQGPNARLGQDSSPCPDFSLEAEANQFYRPGRASNPIAAAQGIVFAVIASSPFWALALIAFLYFRSR